MGNYEVIAATAAALHHQNNGNKSAYCRKYLLPTWISPGQGHYQSGIKMNFCKWNEFTFYHSRALFLSLSCKPLRAVAVAAAATHLLCIYPWFNYSYRHNVIPGIHSFVVCLDRTLPATNPREVQYKSYKFRDKSHLRNLCEMENANSH